MSEPKRVSPPLTDKDLEKLESGDPVLITGILYTARDMAHKKLCDLLDKGEPLPLDIKGQILYFVGPTPPKPGQVIGSAGPTTAQRMDKYSPKIMAAGLKGMIGKGNRGPEVVAACKKYKCVYFAAIGGLGALLAKHIKSAEVVAYPELGTEAIRKLTVEDFPAMVINDIHGHDAYQIGKQKYRKV